MLVHHEDLVSNDNSMYLPVSQEYVEDVVPVTYASLDQKQVNANGQSLIFLRQQGIELSMAD